MAIATDVLDRYSAAARQVEPNLCCAVDYDPALLRILPDEIIARDYGCGDPSRYVREGDVVLDLGSGGGKICYMAAQLVGSGGRVIGIDMNDDMLDLARRHQAEMAEKLGGDRVDFRKGHIEDLALNLGEADAYLEKHPIRNAQDLSQFQAWQDQQRRERPLIPDASVDLVVSNCVLNLVDDAQKTAMVNEIARVLRPGGRIAISDIVSDEQVPTALKQDADLWTGCISGAFQENEILETFAEAGFGALSFDKWDAEPWQTVEGIEFRSVTVTGVKRASGECLDVGHAVIYRGPFSEVRDEEGHIFPRGERMAVCERTYRFLSTGPLAESFIGIPPLEAKEPVLWCAPPGTRRLAAETRGSAHEGTDCGPGCC